MHCIHHRWNTTGLRLVFNILMVFVASLSLPVLAQSGAASSAATGAGSAAQDYPKGQVKFVVGFPPGGSSDIVTRLLAQKFQDRWGKPVVVEQKVGATGLIANDYVVKSAPDGLNMVLLTGGHPVSAAILKKLPYDPVRDFAMVSTVTNYPMVMGVMPESPIKSVADLVARARAEPGKINFSSAGVGSAHHLFGEWFNLAAGVSMTHIPFKGAAPAITELLGGRIDVMVETMTFMSGQVKSGRIRALAVSSREPSAELPGIPTINQTYPEIEFSSWLGLAVAPGTPTAIIDKLNFEVRQVLQMADVRQRLQQLGGEPAASTPEEMRVRVEREVARWVRVVDSRKIERQ